MTAAPLAAACDAPLDAAASVVARAHVLCSLNTHEDRERVVIQSFTTVAATRPQLFELFSSPARWSDFALFSFEASSKAERLRVGATAYACHCALCLFSQLTWNGRV